MIEPANSSQSSVAEEPSQAPSNRPRSSSASSNKARDRNYAPLIPSQLRQSYRPPTTPNTPLPMPGNDYFQGDGLGAQKLGTGSRRRKSFNDDTWDQGSCNGDQNECEHGTFSPRLNPANDSPDGYDGVPEIRIRSTSAHGGRQSGEEAEADHDAAHSLMGDAVADGIFGSKTGQSTTEGLAKRFGISNKRTMYLFYYFPFTRWIFQLRWHHVAGDFIAALTMASFYIPMSLSYASNLGHLPPINGLYSFVINPLIYALLGTSPQMVVGPEAAGSLLTGNVVRDSISRGKVGDNAPELHAQVAGVVTGVAGAILLVAGIARLGFLDNVLSKPFLRGFISAIGVVIFVDQLIPELGLNRILQQHKEAEHGSTVVKVVFLFEQLGNSHALTAAIAFGSFAAAMICREIKRRLQPKYPRVAYAPDRFLIVAITTILTWQLNLEAQGVAVLGDVASGTKRLFAPEFPFDFSHMKHLESALSTSFIISLLGFFESTVAAKSLGAGPPDGIKDITLSANRELIALGAANVVGGTFMALPAFGGYGRSKVNSSTGGTTPLSSIFLSLITLFSILVLMPAFYFIPKGVLSAMISVVAWSLIEEAPADLKFFWQTRAWTELFLAGLVFFATIFYSLPLGIACGIGFSLLRIIKHATRPRIQILGRVHGTSDQFENAEADPERMEFIEGCLIVKIPEPLHFANSGDLKERLRRLESYGSASVHPALPRVRNQEHNKNVIFDIHGVTSLDGAGAQVLAEIIEGYKNRGVRIFFCRVPHPRSKVWSLLDRSGIIDNCGGPRHFVSSVQEALAMTELESLTEWFRDHEA